MKKTLLTFFCALTALFAAAQTEKIYTEKYVVSVDGTATEAKQGEIRISDNGNNTINFTLRDFTLMVGGQELNVGDVDVVNVPIEQGEDGLSHFATSATYTVPVEKLPADLQSMAPLLQNLPLILQGKMNDEKLYATLDITIDNPYLTQNIFVKIGTDNFPPANGKIFTEPLVVTINGASTDPQNTDVTVIFNADGTINFELKNFVLTLGDDDMGVGNIALENLAVTETEDGLKAFAYDGPLFITEGNKEGIDTWIGPILGEIPLVLVGKMSDDKLYVTIDIDMQEAIGQVIYVQVGTDDFPVSKKGDANGDGNIDIADCVTILNAMAEGTDDALADVNKDGNIDIADCVTVLNIMAE